LLPDSTAKIGTELFNVRFIGLLGGGRIEEKAHKREDAVGESPPNGDEKGPELMERDYID
jgi:hypothetical protein